MDVLLRVTLLKRELDSLRPFSSEDEKRVMDKFRLDWNYHSNNLEGNSLTYGETKALLLHNITAQGKPLKDHLETKGHDEAIKWLLEIVKQDRPLTENFIRELHKLILHKPYEVDAITPEGKPTKRKITIGAYKSAPNHVKTKTGEIFRFATPEETPSKMADLLDWYRNEQQQDDVNAILLAAEFHYKFILIHPFDDGNGRTARIIMNFILMQYGYPPIVIKTEDKENYFRALRQADAGLIDAFTEYLADNLVHSLELMINGVKGNDIEEDKDIEKEIALLKARFNKQDQITTRLSNDVLLNFYDTVVRNLYDEFLLQHQELRQFYLSFDARVFVNSSSAPGTNQIEVNRPKLDGKHTNHVSLDFSFNQLNKKGITNSSYSVRFKFIFNDINFELRNNNELIITDYYDNQPSINDIKNIVRNEVKNHVSHLKSRM